MFSSLKTLFSDKNILSSKTLYFIKSSKNILHTENNFICCQTQPCVFIFFLLFIFYFLFLFLRIILPNLIYRPRPDSKYIYIYIYICIYIYLETLWKWFDSDHSLVTPTASDSNQSINNVDLE